MALPFDQGLRDKILTPGRADQLELAFARETQPDENLSGEDWHRLMDGLRGKLIVMHNSKFDLTMLDVGTRHHTGVDLGSNLLWDTMLASAVLEPLELKGLDAASQRIGLSGKRGIEHVVDWLTKRKLPTKRYDLAPWALVEPYVAGDAELTWELYKHQHKELEWGDPRNDELWREQQLAVVLFRMERRGIAYDYETSLAEADKLEERAHEIETRMPFRADVNSAKRYFFKEQGLTCDRPTPKGGNSLDEEQVRDWIRAGVPWAQEYRDVSRMRRAVSMWYRGYPEKIGEDGRLRCSYRQATVRSGRLSVERVQLQALPKADKIEDGAIGVKELVRAKEGHGLWSLDMQQAELRVASQYAQCQLMLEMLAAGRDIHGETTQEVMGVDPKAKDYKLKRDIGKRLTFGGIFQIGGKTFQATLAKLAGIHMEQSECDALVRKWRRMYPEFGVAYRKAEQRVLSSGYARILPGTEHEMKSWFGVRDYPNTGWNRMVQGSLAAWLAMWLINVEENWPGALVLTVHDSIVLELPEESGDKIAAEVAAFSAERATALFDIDMPVEVDRLV
jgi:DNA polymerase-1